ncbi:MAG: CRISPR-associated endoribonuclease Cas6 [Syntrophothermus sp.]
MRLKLILSTDINTSIPVNYNYALSSAIYKLLQFSSPEFAEFLHGKGFKTNQRTYKLFTFSLRPEKSLIFGRDIILKSPFVNLFITTPLVEDFVKSILSGTAEQKIVELFADYTKVEFCIRNIEVMQEPNFGARAKFIMLNPLVLSTRVVRNGRKQQYYLRYDEDPANINRILNINLANKYELMTGREYNGPGVALSWDQDYIRRMLENGKKMSKKITITKDPKNPIDIIGIQCPFVLEGDPELIKTGYRCGFGEKNSMGFGMAEVVNTPSL